MASPRRTTSPTTSSTISPSYARTAATANSRTAASSGHGEHLRLDGVSFGYPGRRVLTDVSFSVSRGDRTGLIGENGAGKSTLLLIAAGLLVPDAGLVTRPASLGLLRQELMPPPGATLEDVLETAVAPVRGLEPLLEQLSGQLAIAPQDAGVADAYDATLRRAEESGLWSLDARISEVLAGLGLAGVERSRSAHSLSGGQRRRLAVAALLLERPAALLLDEPTNHLDDDAVAFLAAELRARRGPLLMASHDRWFLDAVATDLVDLDPAPGAESPAGPSVQGRRFTGGYTDYLAARTASRRRWRDAFQEQETERERLRRIADVDGREIFHTTVPRTEARGAKKFYSDRAAKTVGGRVRSARRGLADLERSAVPEPPQPLVFHGMANPRGWEGTLPIEDGAEILCLKEAGVEGRLRPVDLVVRAGDRLLVEGRNGAGKSTLLAVLAGSLVPVRGDVQRAPQVEAGLLLQEDRWPDPGLPAADAYRSRLAFPREAPSLAELGLLRADEEEQPLAELSPGQRRRVALAVLMAEPPQLLLLDEPTNHLALSLAEELEQALSTYPGTVVVASHDRWFRRRWNGRRITL
ncbi:ABC-F family ATP-binding cassette domain-containing protein [Arthrobacter citreus]|uniref:ABC-F family ATP-binding cassette domain-containing protein n=1 Tax=Arthrobacter TaxID=1663 RepID=UPI0012656355|nr:ABC-F family ATP-binding cassette domain-containing protein [Arthrobacter gandavensis]